MLAVATTVSTSALAGGLLTNTNQNIAFNRNFAREATIGIDGVYSNPAGVMFLIRDSTYRLTSKTCIKHVAF